jgi:hypothetical protein
VPGQPSTMRTTPWRRVVTRRPEHARCSSGRSSGVHSSTPHPCRPAGTNEGKPAAMARGHHPLGVRRRAREGEAHRPHSFRPAVIDNDATGAGTVATDTRAPMRQDHGLAARRTERRRNQVGVPILTPSRFTCPTEEVPATQRIQSRQGVGRAARRTSSRAGGGTSRRTLAHGEPRNLPRTRSQSGRGAPRAR